MVTTLRLPASLAAFPLESDAQSAAVARPGLSLGEAGALPADWPHSARQDAPKRLPTCSQVRRGWPAAPEV